MTQKSAPSVALRVRLPCGDEQELVSRMARAFSPAGMFLSTKAPKEPGTRLLFEVLYADGSPALRGEGTVVRAVADSLRPGMTIAFTRLDPPSRALLGRIAAVRRGTPPAGMPLEPPQPEAAPVEAPVAAEPRLPAPGPRPQLPASAPEITLGIDLGGSFLRAAALAAGTATAVTFDGLPALSLPPDLGQGDLPLLLELARNAAEAQGSGRVSRTVIAVPPSTGPLRRAALRAAARSTGLPAVRILSDTAARAVACGAGRGLARKRLLLLDAGARFSAGLVEITGDEIDVVASLSIEGLGEEIDERLASLALRDLELARGPVEAEARARVVRAARSAKEILCTEERTRLQVPAVAGDESLDVELDRATLAEAAGPPLDRALAAARDLLRARSLAPAQVDEVILSGGQAALPPLLARAAEAFGPRLRSEIDAGGSAATGAALAGAALDGERRDLQIHEVLGWPVSLLGSSGPVRVLEKNAQLPAERVVRLEGPRHGVAALAVVADNEPVAGLVLPGPRAAVLVRVDRDGTVELTAAGGGPAGEPADPSSLVEAAALTMIEPGPAASPPPTNAESGGLLGNIRRFFGRPR